MSLINILIAFLFGVVEGITEWLPISSTGHMILLNEVLHLNVTEDFFNLYLVVIQLGAILAVLVVFWKDIWPFGKKDNKKPLSKGGVLSYVKVDKFIMWFKIMVACIPAAVVGVLFDDILDKYLYNYFVVAIALFVFGIAFLVTEHFIKDKKPKCKDLDELTYIDALIIGFFQLLAAIFPGTSRSGATIVGSLMIGVSREVAAKFTFFMAIPVMFGASLLKIVKYNGVITINELVLLGVGMISAFIVSIVIIKFLLGYIRKHNFNIFAVYRIILAFIVIVVFKFVFKR